MPREIITAYVSSSICRTHEVSAFAHRPLGDFPSASSSRVPVYRGGMPDESYSFVVVSNRLPVDRVVDDAGNASWKQSPGGLVTALEPVMRAADGAWVGWAGQADLE